MRRRPAYTQLNYCYACEEMHYWYPAHTKRTPWRRWLIRIGAWLVFILVAAAVPATAKANDCTPEPASQWAPAGWICPPRYGEGTASTWGGPGAARNDCTYPFTACEPLTVRSLDTGRVITITPTTWCMCWVGVVGPAGERERIIDLGPEQWAALGLPGPGLYRVEVRPAVALPNTSIR